MIKLIAFDLDGVLVDSRELHYNSLNLALEELDPDLVISREEHLSTYDGRSTTEKLKLLTKHKGLCQTKYDEVWKNKQYKTAVLISHMEPDHDKINILKSLKDRGYIIHVCSNSIKHSIKLMLLKKGLIEFVDEIFSNQDVNKSKPHPEIYMRSMLKAVFSPKGTLAF